MRQTFTELQTTTKDYISLGAGSFASSTITNFIKEHLNKRYQLALSRLRNYQTQWTPRTAVTVANQQYYYNPPDMLNINSATLTIGGVAYPLTVIDSEREWNRLNMIDFSGTTIPQYIFPRRNDFGIYPKPTSSGNTITIVGNLKAVEMTVDDYITGSVTATQNSSTIIGLGTTWTNAMIGRWFIASGGDKRWYRIASWASATQLILETVYEGFTVTGSNYVIGESPELPDEIHDILPHGAAADYFAGPRKDFPSAQAHLNYFYSGDFNNSSRNVQKATGGLLGAVNLYSSRANTNIVYRNKQRVSRFDEAWSTTLS